jgi:protein TonB
VIIQPVAPPVKPQELQADDKPEPDQPATPQMVAVTLETPAINFAVPTIGTLLVPNSVAVAPPVAPLRRAAAPVQKALPSSVASTGAGGDRPQPTYPKLAIQLGQQGAVTLLVTGDAAGRVVAASVQESSGFPLLDSSTLEFVKRHWILPRGDGPREYVATIKYRLE